MKTLLAIALAGCLCLAFPGCTARSWYDGFKEQQRQDCYQYKSQKEIQDCLDRVNGMSYEQYEKAREAPGRKQEY